MYNNYGSNYQNGATEKNENLNSKEAVKLKFKFNIGIEEIRELIDLLNRKPFDENLTLVSFDEQNKTELLELLNKVLGFLDASQNVVLRNEKQEDTEERILQFCRVLDYPGRLDGDIGKSFMTGDR